MKIEQSFLNASKKGYVKTMEKHIKKGVDVNLQDAKKNTALIWASYYEQIDAIKLLIKNKANVNMQDEYGYTALHWASRYDFTDIIKLLIENDADVNTQAITGETALVLAIQYGHLKTAKFLIENNTDVNIKNKINSKTALDVIKATLDVAKAIEDKHEKEHIQEIIDLIKQCQLEKNISKSDDYQFSI